MLKAIGKTKILFLCGSNSCRSQMAEGLLKKLINSDGDELEVFSAGVTSSVVHEMALKVMNEISIDISSQVSESILDLDNKNFDIIITLCGSARDFCIAPGETSDGGCSKTNLFIGKPIHLHWPVVDPAIASGSESEIEDAFRIARDDLTNRIETLYKQGYIKVLMYQRRETEKILDLIKDGIVAHDQSRSIYIFNKAAEKITGRSRDEVLGMDCHKVFPPNGLCGSECRFKAQNEAVMNKQEYFMSFTNDDGQDKNIKVSAVATDIAHGKAGVLALMRDVTEVNDLRWRLKNKRSFHGMVGISKGVQDVFETIRQVSTSDYPVLITGESGTGKELVANAIHNESRRKKGPFVPVNCGALPDNILESELFGHVRGAFTGAIRDKKGRFELAHGGTLFLDEVGELSPIFQVRLLRVLQEKQFERVGGEKEINVDVRVIAATNRDLRLMVKKGEFREDLFYRLCVVPILLPPLRERREDIPFLTDEVIKRISKENNNDLIQISDESMELLFKYNWPGNIRELINALQFASVRSRGEKIEIQHLPPETRDIIVDDGMVSLEVSLQKESSTGSRQRKLDIGSVKSAISEAKGNKVKAAKILGVGRATLYRFLNDHPL